MTAATVAAAVPQGEGQQVERTDPDHRHAQGLGDGLAGGETDAHPGEQAGPDVDCDGTEFRHLDVGLFADELDRGDQRFGVTPTAADLEQARTPS